MLRFALVAALVASTVAFAPPKSAAVQPRKVNVNAPLAKALELRGGGIISKDAFITTMVIANVPFGLQFLLMPKMFLSMFFDKEFDKFHYFLSRFCGVLILGQSALLKVCPADIAFPVAALTQVAVALVGPLYAQFNLGPKMPIHLFPVIVVNAICALALLAI